MGRWLIAVATAVLVSCGSSSSSPTYNGGINGTPPSGSSGFSFTPVDGGAFIVGPATCTVPGFGSAHVTGILLGFSSFSGMCSFVRDHGVICLDVGKASATSIGLGILHIDAVTAVPIGAGTYTISGQPVVVGTGATEALGTVSVTNAACVDSGPATVSGTSKITITAASAAQVTGNVSLNWTGGAFSGPFDLVGCTANVDVCALVNEFISGNVSCSGCF